MCKSFLHLLVLQHIQTTMMHTRQEKRLCVVCSHHYPTAKQAGEHIAHHVLALSLIEEQRKCQMIHLRVVCLEQTFDLTPSNSSSLGRVDANITLRSLVRHFFSCHTLIIQFRRRIRRRKCKAEKRFFSIQTQFFYFWGVFSTKSGEDVLFSILARLV